MLRRPKHSCETDSERPEFDRISNVPNPNPRYGGSRVIEATWRLLQTVPKKTKYAYVESIQVHL